MYLETVAIIPQLYLFQRTKGQIESWTSHFVFTLGLSRFLYVLFWVSSYHELAEPGKSITGGWVGIFVLMNNIIQLLVMIDYCYYYIKAAKSGTNLQLPNAMV